MNCPDEICVNPVTDQSCVLCKQGVNQNDRRSVACGEGRETPCISLLVDAEVVDGGK